MSTERATTHQNGAPADATEEDPAPEDQGIIVTAQPPRSDDDAESDDAGQTDRRGDREHEGPLPASPTPQDRDAER